MPALRPYGCVRSGRQRDAAPSSTRVALAVRASALVVVVALLSGGTAQAATSSQPLPGWVTDGDVSAVERVGGRVFLGGSFRRVGPRSGAAAVLSAATGVREAAFPEIAGVYASVAAAQPDGSGGWYVGGRFSLVGGEARQNLVHVRADGSVDPAFVPAVDGPVWDMALYAGRLYIAGYFASVAGAQRTRLAALDADDGSLLAWNPAPPPTHSESGPFINDIAAGDSRIYVAGQFDEMGGAPRANLAAVDPETGQANAFVADVGFNPGSLQGVPAVDALALAGDTLYFGGRFEAEAGEARKSVAAVDSATGQLRAWDPKMEWVNQVPAIQAIAAGGGRVFVGGGFASIGGAARSGLTAIDAATAEPLPWDPGFADYPSVNALEVSGDRLYAAGFFNFPAANGGFRGLLGIDVASGQIEWGPLTDDAGLAIAVEGERVLAGGEFHSVAMRDRAGLAALDARTGVALDWNPKLLHGADFPGSVGTLAAVDRTLYLSGYFESVDGVARAGLAAVDPMSGKLSAWKLAVSHVGDGLGAILGASRDAVYITTFGEQEGETSVRAFDAATGKARRFRVSLPAEFTAIEPAGGLVYVAYTPFGDGSPFDTGPAYVTARNGSDAGRCWTLEIAGATEYRRRIGAFDLELSGRRLYVGGHFLSVAGRHRSDLAAVDAETGRLERWNPHPSAGEVTKIVAAGDSVFVAGIFGYIDEQPRNGLAELSATDGHALDFYPSPWGGTGLMYASPSAVQDVAVGPDGLVHVGGSFRGTADSAVRGYAAFDGAPTGGRAKPELSCPDTTPPSITVRPAANTLDETLRHGIQLVVRSSEPARLSIQATISARSARHYGLAPGSSPKRVVIARRHVGLERGKNRLRLRVASRVRRALRDVQQLSVLVSGRARDGAGNDSHGVRALLELEG